MNFTDLPFLYLLAVVYGLWFLLRRTYRARLLVLLTGSLLFYGYYVWWLPLLLIAYCDTDWALARWIERSRRPRVPLILGLCLNLGLLAFWKYTPMALGTLLRMSVAWDLALQPTVPTDWFIPIGISFYAFTGIAYMVDVYRGDRPAEKSIWRFALYMTFFPQLVAGPILRAAEFLPDLQPGRLPTSPRAPLEAGQLLARGFFKKMVLADRIAVAIDPFFAHVADATTAGVWSLPYIYLYAFQIYFDFSGYTDIARGLGLLFGFRWPENFRLPYLATSIQDFWRRWHITLSLFLKDYLYIPLGGSRHGRLRTNLNLLLTMLLGGLWHGASWSFVLWGGLHGVLLVGNRLWQSFFPGARLTAGGGSIRRLWQAASIVLTFHCVCLGWCFFRLDQLGQSLACVKSWFLFDADKLLVGGANDLSLWLLLGTYAAAWALLHYAAKTEWLPPKEWTPQPLLLGVRWGAVIGLLLLATLLAPGIDAPPFIYFQF